MGREVQRALLWVILFGSLFMLWDNYQVWKGGESFFGSAKQEAIEADRSAAAGVPTATVAKTAPVLDDATAVNEPIVVTTDRMKVTFDRMGLELLVPKCFSSRNKPIGLKWVLPVWCLVGNPPPTLAM